MNWVGFDNYVRSCSPFRPGAPRLVNIAIFATLYIVICTAIGLMLAIFLDQKIRGEGVLRPIYLYPMALSASSSPAPRGNGSSTPASGWNMIMHLWGWESFKFGWIKDRRLRRSIRMVIAAVWQSSGFVMAMFLAGLRGIDNEMMKAAQIDGASNWQLYRRIVIPLLRPAFLSAFVILAHLAIKSYDLVIALTGGGPGRATETARDLHVFLYLHPQPDGHRRRIRRDHADGRGRDHDPLHLRRTEGAEVMSHVAHRTRPSVPAASPAPSSMWC
jgi:glucose/mannose transport system permease protein